MRAKGRIVVYLSWINNEQDIKIIAMRMKRKSRKQVWEKRNKQSSLSKKMRGLKIKSVNFYLRALDVKADLKTFYSELKNQCFSEEKYRFRGRLAQFFVNNLKNKKLLVCRG
jgi:hypothetical protein